MKHISNSQKTILEKLIFMEDYNTILRETGLDRGSLRDDLINLLNGGFVEAYEFNRTTDPSRVTSFDSDNLSRYYFRATREGLQATQLSKL